jgi:hypothetical protein
VENTPAPIEMIEAGVLLLRPISGSALPAMFAQLCQQILIQRTRVAGGDIGSHVP